MGEYSWLSEYQRTWEEVKLTKEKPPEDLPQSHLRPLLRRVVLVLDYSKSSLKKDFKPSRHKLISQISDSFEDYFYTYNPLSKLQVIISKSGKAFCATDKPDLCQPADGEFSLQNTIDLSLKLLEDTGPHWSSEILIVLNSLSTCDPGDVWSSLQTLRENHIRVSVISMCARWFTLEEFTKQTGGRWVIAENEARLREHWELFAKTGHPAYSAALVPMAFPWASSITSPCACHLEMREGFICPVCGCKVCKLPTQCPICRYVLVGAPHLTKASLSMAPLQQFEVGEGVCLGCGKAAGFKCPSCSSLYCQICHEFIHSSLGKCIGCSF